MNTENNKRISVITYFGEINEPRIVQLIDVLNKAKAANSSEIHLHISSTGGNLHAGFAAYYHLRSLNIPIVTHNFGNVESSAILLFLAADIRHAAIHSTFLLHDFNWTYPAGQIRIGAMRENLQSLDFDSERYAKIFDERTQKSFDIRGCLTGAAQRLDADAAAAAGITTGPANDPTIPAGAILWWVT